MTITRQQFQLLCVGRRKVVKAYLRWRQLPHFQLVVFIREDNGCITGRDVIEVGLLPQTLNQLFVVNFNLVHEQVFELIRNRIFFQSISFFYY